MYTLVTSPGTSNPTVTNTIIWGNTAASGNPNILNTIGTPTFSYCDIQGSGGSGSWVGAFGSDGGSNIDSDPTFVDAPNENLRVFVGSPVIDAGINYANTEPYDLAGNARIQNGTIDMGAYEGGESSIYAGSDASICDGMEYALTGATASGVTTYAWTTSGTGNFNNAAILNPVYNPNGETGAITLTLTGDGTAVDAMVLTVGAVTIPTISPAGPVAICPGGSVDLSIPAVGGASYCWYDVTADATWSNVGSAGFSADWADDISLQIHPTTDEPWVAYRDKQGATWKTSVMKYDGTSWQNVGPAIFSAGASAYHSLAFNPISSLAYVAYQDAANSSGTTVMKQNGSGWQEVGTAGFSQGSAEYVSMAFHPTSGEPYVAYRDNANSDYTSVMKFNGRIWVIVGAALSSTGNANYQQLAFHPTTYEPYVVFQDFGNSSKATVMKFNSTNWELVGSAGFSAGETNGSDIAFNPLTGHPYVAYQDVANLFKATVMMFDGSSWQDVGTAGFSTSTVYYTNIDFNSSGEAYVTYADETVGYNATAMKFAPLCLGAGNLLNVTTAGTFEVEMTNAAGCKVTSSNQVAVTVGCLLTRDGSTDTDWNTADNWDQDIVPSLSDDVLIPDVANGPVIASGIGADCKNIEVNSSASLTVESGGSLITNGTITNNGTVNMNQSIDDGEWHLVSIPTTGITANIFLLDYLQNWDETIPGWGDIIEPTTPLNTNIGYALWTTGSKSDYTYTGTPLTGMQSAAITLSNNFPNPAVGNDGANLLGNPYPSSIDWSGLDDTWGAVYYWDPSANAGLGDYIEWNNNVGAGSQYIPPMQGFFIVADVSNTTAGTGIFELTNDDRTHSGATSFYKSKIQNGIVLEAVSGNSTDELFIRFDAETSPGFDLRSDALKFVSGVDGVSQLYTYGEDYKLAIDTRPETETIQLGFENETSGIYSISAKEMDGITKALLEETKTTTFHDLSKAGYEFAWDVTDDEKRFKLHLNTVGIEENQISESNILIYATDQQIFIKPDVQTDGRLSLSVTDIMGRIVLQQNISASEMTTIPVNLKTGIYLIVLQNGNKLVTEKVFIK